MSRYYYCALDFLSTRWRQTKPITLSLLNNPQPEISIVLPPDKYNDSRAKKPLIASFYVYEEISPETTPLNIFGILRNSAPIHAGALYKYVEGNNTWLLSREIMLLNNTIVFIDLPTNPKTLVIGMDLMKINSRLAKFIKEKILTEVDLKTTNIEFRDTSAYRPAKYLQGPITPDLIEELLLKEMK